MKSDRALVASGVAGIAAVAICCGLPLLAAALFAAGLIAWLADFEWLLILPPLLCLGLIARRLYRRRRAQGLPHEHL
jgi:hypothetical protein